MIKDALEYLFHTANTYANRQPNVSEARGRFRYVTLNGERKLEELRPRNARA